METWLHGLSRVPSEIVILSGAGTSVDGPSCIPPGLGVTRRVLEEAAGLTVAEISSLAGAFESCGMPGGFPRFETVLGVVAETLGEAGLRTMLRDILEVRPNDLHAFFAEHIAAGGPHITANIDCGIERAGASGSAVIHFHGAADRSSDLAPLGITLANVENGFSQTMEDLLRATLLSPSIRGMVVVGYSGSDYFDMSPFLEGLSSARSLSGRSVLWLEFDADNPSLRIDESNLPPRSTTAETIASLRRAGAVVTVLRGSVRLALARLARHWGLPGSNLKDSPSGCEKLVPVTVPTDQLPAVRVCLYERLGYLPGIEIEELRDPSNLERSDVHAMADWNRGRYRAAAAKWQRSLAHHPEGHLLSEERVVACDWVAGRYVRASIGLRRLLRRLEATPEVSLSTRLVIADTGARLWDHMRRLPDTRWFATKGLQRRLIRSLPTEEAGRAARLPPDLHDRLLVALVKIDPASHTPEEVEALHLRAYERNSQTSSIVRTLNYLQGSVRQTAPNGVHNAADILQLWEGWRRIGADGEAVRLFTIPGASHVVGLRKALRYQWTAPVDYPLYHRIRVLSITIALHLRHRGCFALTRRTEG